MLNKLLFITVVLLVVGAQAVHVDAEYAARIAEALKRVRSSTPSTLAPQDNKANIEDFVQGFVKGVGSAPIFSVIKPCISDDETILKDLAQSVNYLRSHNPEDVKKGIKLLGDAAKIVPVAASYCAATGFDIKRVIQMIQVFENPASFIVIAGRNILINHVEVIHEVKSLVEAYNTKNYNSLGFWVARAMVTVTLGQSKPVQVKDSKADLENFTKGFLTGIGSASEFDSLKSCIADDETIITNVDKGIQLIKTKTPENVKKGVQMLGDAVNLVPTAAQLCKASGAEIEKLDKLIKTFTDPKTFLYFVGKSLLINHVEVIHEVEGAVDAYEDKNMTGLGFWVGKAMDTIFLGGNQVAKTLRVNDAKADLEAFAQGFLGGIETADLFTEIKTCLGDEEAILLDLKNGITLIRTKDATKVKQGIQLIGKAAQILPAAAVVCKVADAKVEKLISLVKSFTTPQSFFYFVGKSLLINHVEVIHEVENVVNDYSDKNFTGTGFWVGKTMATIFLSGKHGNLIDTKSDLTDFAKGFLSGIGSASVFNDLKACINDDQEIVKEIETGVQDIKTKNPEKVKEGVQLIGKATQIIPVAAQMCQATSVEIQKLVKLIQSFTNPESFLYYVGKSLIINHVEVISEVNQAVEAYNTHNLNRLGFWVGKAMATIFLGDKRTLRDSFVGHLNQKSGWKAGMPEKFKGMTVEEIKKNFLGANILNLGEIHNLTVLDYTGMTNDVPDNFDARKQWPNCIHPIRDQQHCGSCWAFSASEVLSDRFCIASNGDVDVVLSPQYLVSCNNVLNHGCNGGVPVFSWWFIASQGLVTDACLPYQSGNGTNPVNCKDFKQCADGSQMKNYHSKKGSTVTLKNPASIQQDLIKYGPVEAAFSVYEDFIHYQGGVYKHTSGSLLGGHAVKIVGWGVEDGTNYWIVANSWNTSWGEDGFFRIAWGECGIDAQCVSGQADTTKAMQSQLRWF